MFLWPLLHLVKEHGRSGARDDAATAVPSMHRRGRRGTEGMASG